MLEFFRHVRAKAIKQMLLPRRGVSFNIPCSVCTIQERNRAGCMV